MARQEVDVLQGTLDMLVLKALTWGRMHGYSILAWLRQTTDGELRIEDAALYPALHRMEARGLIEADLWSSTCCFCNSAALVSTSSDFWRLNASSAAIAARPALLVRATCEKLTAPI